LRERGGRGEGGEEEEGSPEGHWEEPRVENTITLLIDGAMATI
jgi:hypothetical protein